MNFIILAGTRTTLQTQVQEHLDNGWSIHGPMLHRVDMKEEFQLIQAMTKPKDPVITEERQVTI